MKLARFFRALCYMAGIACSVALFLWEPEFDWDTTQMMKTLATRLGLSVVSMTLFLSLSWAIKWSPDYQEREFAGVVLLVGFFCALSSGVSVTAALMVGEALLFPIPNLLFIDRVGAVVIFGALALMVALVLWWFLWKMRKLIDEE